MATHLDDEEQLENLKRWWSENWLALAVGVGIGLAAIGGWEGWQRYHDGQALQASLLFEDMNRAAAADQAEPLQTAADRLLTDFPKTPYATAAALTLAQRSVEQGLWNEASERLSWVQQNGHDEGTRTIASLRRARVLWQQGKSEEAIAQLNATPTAEAYQPLFDELRGDIRLTQGDRAAARAAYLSALGAATTEQVQRDLLQQKLDDLAVASEKAES